MHARENKPGKNIYNLGDHCKNCRGVHAWLPRVSTHLETVLCFLYYVLTVNCFVCLLVLCIKFADLFLLEPTKSFRLTSLRKLTASPAAMAYAPHRAIRQTHFLPLPTTPLFTITPMPVSNGSLTSDHTLHSFYGSGARENSARTSARISQGYTKDQVGAVISSRVCIGKGRSKLSNSISVCLWPQGLKPCLLLVIVWR